MGDGRGSIAFFGTYRPPVPLDIYSCPANPPPSSAEDELHLTDGVSYNQNARAIPAAALKELLTCLCKKNPKLAAECGTSPDDADKGRVTGLVFVSERDNGLETLHVALRFTANDVVKVPRLALSCRRTGSSGSRNGIRERDQYDLSPAVSPSGKMVAVANFRFNKWTGEIERLNTDIVVMNVDKQVQGGLRRKILIRDGGWPTWGSDNIIFFHRGIETNLPSGKATVWGVFRYNIATKETIRVTPETFDAMTPAAISETKVAVATIRQKSLQAVMTVQRVDVQYRHIEIFDVTALDQPVQISRKTRPKGDHYNPFVVDGGSHIGYHRCRTDNLLKDGSLVPKSFDKMQSPLKDVGLFRVTGVFPTISKDGSKLAFVDNEFKAVWLADSQEARFE
ncbi:hypothetical protein ACQ4PT_038849 [Festuca glaucescens]